MGLFDSPEMPMGLGMALVRNPTALQKYSSLSPEQKRALIDRTHLISSKQDMEVFVDSIADGNNFQ